MKSRAAILATAALSALLGAAIFCSAGPANTADAEASALAPVAWMAGDWETHDATPYVEERWTRPAGGSMLGNSRTIKDGKMVEFEFLRIEARPDGIFYMPQPSGKPPVDFKFTATTSNEAVFVNPGHADHLKKITYRKNADGTLAARIEGENNGKPFAKDWHYFPQMSNGSQSFGSPMGSSWDLRPAWVLATISWWQVLIFVVALAGFVIYMAQDKKRAVRRRLELDSRR